MTANTLRRLFLLSALTLMVSLAACQDLPATTPSPIEAGDCVPVSQEPQTAVVVHIADGDTITVAMDGQRYRVRYIGIDTPELNSAENDLAEQASRLNEALVSGQTVTLYRDTSETDRYDRLLRYVFVGDDFINYDLVNQGAARAKDYPPDSACADTFAGAQDNAQQAGLGIWASDD